MSSFSISISNLPNVQKQLAGMASSIEKEVRAEMTAFGTSVVRDAKALAPVDEGHLKSSISFAYGTEDKGLTIEVIVATDYAAYVEFGTRSFAAAYVATLPADWQTFASQYRGKGGGTFAELVERLTRWVRLKGISGQYEFVSAKPKRLGATGKGKGFASGKARQEAEDYTTAYLIALSILKKGSKAHPFLYPAIQHNKALLIERLNAMFK